MLLSTSKFIAMHKALVRAGNKQRLGQRFVNLSGVEDNSLFYEVNADRAAKTIDQYFLDWCHHDNVPFFILEATEYVVKTS